MNWRQPESWTPPARLGDKWIATRGQMNSGHPESQTPPSEHSRTPLERELRTPTVNCLGTDGRHKAQGGGHSPWHRTWETKDGRQMMGDTEPREADTAPDTRRTHLKIELSTPTVSCLGNNLDIAKAGHHQPHGDRDAQRAEPHQPDWETNGLPQGETHELETAKAGHHQPDWETNESVYGETNELETAERPDTTSQTGKQMSCHKGRQMNWRQPEPDTNSQIGRQMNCHKEKQINVEQSESRTTTSEPSRTPL